MVHARGLRRSAALMAAGAVLVPALAGCGGDTGEDDGSTRAVEQSDSGGSESGGSDSGGSDGGGASDGGDASQDASEYGRDIDLRSEPRPVSGEDAEAKA